MSGINVFLPFHSIHGVLKEKAMAPHSSTLAWKIPWTEEPGRLQSMGSLGVGHDWATSLSLFTFMHWRKQWHPTPVLLPGESQGQGSLVSCHLWGRTESDTTEAMQQQQQQQQQQQHGVLKAQMLKWFAIPFCSGPRFVRTLHHDPSISGGPTQLGS